jgi:2,4-diketo-3-deoxy-L-fuconate hydrolase
VPNTVCGDGDAIPITPTAQFIDYEAEVAIVIGKAGKYIAAEEAAEYIAGVTAMNDVSERRLKLWERKDEREWDKFFDWLNGKWMDNFAPMGPCIVPAADVDLDNLVLRGYVNDELRQEGNTAEMFHSAAKTVEYISLMLTLEPGDVIALGTPAGVGAARGTKLVPGDVVRVEVEGVGALTNPVVAE